MSLAMTITDHWEDGKRVHVTGTFVASGSYATGGDTVPFNNPLIKSASPPVAFFAQAPIGFDICGIPGAFNTTPPSAKLSFVTSSTGLELAAGAYPASITGSVIQFYAVFPKHI